MKKSSTSRRNFITSGIASAAASAIAPDILWSAPKRDGEIRVLYHGGDYYHNGAMQEYQWRYVLGPTGWSIAFAQSPDFITPEVLDQTDLFILCRYATATQPENISLGWSPDKIITERPEPSVFMKPELEDSIAEHVRNGMALLSIHCSIWNPESKKYLKLLGVTKPNMHGPVVPTRIYDLNPDHPITNGIDPFDIGADELFSAEMITGDYEPLYRSKQTEPELDALAGWCREEGTGRVVALLAGHTLSPYHVKDYKEIIWRSAHWALRKESPKTDHLRNGY